MMKKQTSFILELHRELTREIRILNNVGIAGAIFQNQVGEINS